MNEYEKFSWPYSRTQPRPENPGRPSVLGVKHYEPEPEPLTCPTCKTGDGLRSRGTRTSRRDPEDIRQICICLNCNQYLTLPLGQHLPEKPRKTPLVPEAEVAHDPRPSCPYCGGDHINRRGSIGVYKQSWREGRTPGGSLRWACVDCQKSFVTAPYQHTPQKEREKSQLVDRRHHWNPNKGRKAEDVQQEAVALLALVETESDVKEVRELISYTPREKACLEFLASEGLIAQGQVASVLNFRDHVLAKFNRLIDAELAAMPEPKPASEDAVESAVVEGQTDVERQVK